MSGNFKLGERRITSVETVDIYKSLQLTLRLSCPRVLRRTPYAQTIHISSKHYLVTSVKKLKQIISARRGVSDTTENRRLNATCRNQMNRIPLLPLFSLTIEKMSYYSGSLGTYSDQKPEILQTDFNLRKLYRMLWNITTGLDAAPCQKRAIENMLPHHFPP